MNTDIMTSDDLEKLLRTIDVFDMLPEDVVLRCLHKALDSETDLGILIGKTYAGQWLKSLIRTMM